MTTVYMLQRVFRTPNINPYSTYKMALLCVLCIFLDAQFISAGANTVHDLYLYLARSEVVSVSLYSQMMFLVTVQVTLLNN